MNGLSGWDVFFFLLGLGAMPTSPTTQSILWLLGLFGRDGHPNNIEISEVILRVIDLFWFGKRG
jgi:hypothetical protein